MAIRWVSELPPAGKSGRKAVKRPRHWSFAQTLRKQPGSWAILGVFNTSVAYQIGTGKTAAFRPAGAFEAAARDTRPDGRATVYVRYIGEPETEQ